MMTDNFKQQKRFPNCSLFKTSYSHFNSVRKETLGAQASLMIQQQGKSVRMTNTHMLHQIWPDGCLAVGGAAAHRRRPRVYIKKQEATRNLLFSSSAHVNSEWSDRNSKLGSLCVMSNVPHGYLVSLVISVSPGG